MYSYTDGFVKLADGRRPTVVALPGTMCAPAIFGSLAQRLPNSTAAAPWMEWSGPWDLQSIADKTARLCESVGEVVLLGHSTGAAIALMTAQRMKRRDAQPRGVVLCNSGATCEGHGDIRQMILQCQTEWGPQLWDKVANRCVSRPVDTDLWTEMCSYVRTVSPRVVAQVLSSQMTTDLGPVLRDLLDIPMCVIHGREDNARTVDHAQALVMGRPQGTVHFLECGHTPPAESPDEFAEVVLSFLERLTLR